MGPKSLTVEELRLDLQNPRITEATSQREALQRIINDQDTKLVALAQSIVEDGLNPMDRFLVIASPAEAGKYIVIEGNRRLAAIRILKNLSVLTGMEVRPSVQKRLEALGPEFNEKSVEPLDCFEVAAREDGAMWIQQRHTGENGGRGIVDWSGLATARFRGNDPALQALDFVLEHSGLTDAEKGEISDGFPISTLDRLLSTPAVRNTIGVEIKGGKLLTTLPISELLKPLLRMVRDLAKGTVTVADLKLQRNMVDYVGKLGADLPDLTQAAPATVSIEDLTSKGSGGSDPTPPTAPRGSPRARASVRKALIPRECAMSVTTAKIAEIAKELRTLPLANYPHAISILLRVFLELSVDHYLTANGKDLNFKAPGGRVVWKDLRRKIDEAATEMIAQGTPARELDGLKRGIDDQHNPLFIDTLHNYVHNRFYSPTERDLTVAWDNAQPFFERLWA